MLDVGASGTARVRNISSRSALNPVAGAALLQGHRNFDLGMQRVQCLCAEKAGGATSQKWGAVEYGWPVGTF